MGVTTPSTVTALPLLPRIALGDELALRECLTRYGGLVASLSRKYLRNPSEVDDACQEIFVALWKNASAFDATRASEATFVAMVARRRLIDRLRASKARIDPYDTEQFVDAESIERNIDAKAAVEGLESCSAEQRKVIVLASHGHTHSEIAEAMAIPLGTVKSHYGRGIELVKRALEKRTTKR